jgi:cytochrome c oxidase subunit 2
MYTHPYMPAVASEHGSSIDWMLALVHIFILLLFVGWMGFFLYTIIRFRKGAHPVASYVGVKSKANSMLEATVVVVEAVLLLGFSIPLWADRVDEFPEESESILVRVVAEQFVWNFHYPGVDGRFGRTDINLINVETNPLGLDYDDPAAADDITTINQLHLPVNRPVIIHASSKDVIHSFNLPNMRVKQDTIPGLDIPLWFKPVITTAQMREQLGNPDFTYEIACAQLCGLGHYRMKGFMTIHDEAGYEQWLQEQAELLEEGEFDDDW